MNENFIHIKPQSASQLAALYDVSLKTFYNWLKPHELHLGPVNSKVYTVLQVKTIFEKIGSPYTYIKDEDL